MDVPPSRYRVIERDRRLVVIDTRNPGATPAPQPVSDGGATGWLPRRVRFDGAAELTTRAFYDAKGPRTVLLDPAAAQGLRVARITVVPAALALGVLVWSAPFLLVLAAPLLNAGTRAGVRNRITRWLDTQAQR